MASLSFTAPARATVAPASSSRRNVAMMSSSKVLQAEVEVRPGEPFDIAMRRFRRQVNTNGVIFEVRRRRTFENTQDIKKRKEKERHLKNRRKGSVPTLDDVAPLAQTPVFADMFGFDELPFIPRRGNRGDRQDRGPRKLQQAIVVASADVGKILGFRGATQQAMEARTSAHIFIQNMDGSDQDRVIIEGDQELVAKGLELVQAVLEKGAEALDLPTGRNPAPAAAAPSE